MLKELFEYPINFNIKVEQPIQWPVALVVVTVQAGINLFVWSKVFQFLAKAVAQGLR